MPWDGFVYSLNILENFRMFFHTGKHIVYGTNF